MFAKGTDSTILEAKHRLSDIDIATYYLGITKLPTRICSPLREDNKPSFGLYTRDGNKVYWVDFATGDKGSIIDLLCRLWGSTYEQTWLKIATEFKQKSNISIRKTISNRSISLLSNSKTIIETHEREWNDEDIKFWDSYGISKEWLLFANVHPISHIIFIKDNKRIITPADKLAYAFVEFKEGRTTMKVYQPLNTKGFKWFSTHDKSVVSLWTKVPYKGDIIVICSSLKDALCLWSNTGIPTIAPQGEGYSFSDTAIKNLKSRYKNIFILYDNDNPGLIDGESLSKKTGFRNIVLPQFEGGKDISDFYKQLNNKQLFKEQMLKLLTI